jgi:hypothetical protein
MTLFTWTESRTDPQPLPQSMACGETTSISAPIIYGYPAARDLASAFFSEFNDEWVLTFRGKKTRHHNMAALEEYIEGVIDNEEMQ